MEGRQLPLLTPAAISGETLPLGGWPLITACSHSPSSASLVSWPLWWGLPPSLGLLLLLSVSVSYCVSLFSVGLCLAECPPVSLSLCLLHLAALRPSSLCPLTYPPACQPHSPLTFPPIHLQLAGQAQSYLLPLSSLPMKGDTVQEVLLIHPRLLLPWTLGSGTPPTTSHPP